MAAATLLRSRNPRIAFLLRSPFSTAAASYFSEPPSVSEPTSAAASVSEPTSTDAAAVSEPTSCPPPESSLFKRFSALKAAIRSTSDPDSIAELFRSAASDLPRFHAERPIFELTVNKLARARRPDLIDALLSPFVYDPKAPKSEGFFVRLISLFGSAGMPDHAAKIFHCLPQVLAHSCSDKSLSALLSAYLHNRHYDLVIETFDCATKELGIAPGLISYNVFLQALCRKGDVETARNVLDKMTEKGNVPDLVSYNTVLNGCSKKGDDDGFEEILKEMLNRGLEPNVGTYNCRIAKLCQKQLSFQAEELLDVMIMKGIQPDLTTFNTIIGGFCQEGEADSALRVFKRMKVMKRKNGADGVSPSPVICTMLTWALVEKKEFIKALDICNECLARKGAPPFDIVRALIAGLLESSNKKEAMELVLNMRQIVKGEAVDAWNKIETAISW